MASALDMYEHPMTNTIMLLGYIFKHTSDLKSVFFYLINRTKLCIEIIFNRIYEQSVLAHNELVNAMRNFRFRCQTHTYGYE